MKKVFLNSGKSFLIFCLIGIILILCFGIYSLTMLHVKLDTRLITDNNLNIEVYNTQNLLLKESNSYNKNNIKIDFLHDYTPAAFISTEDKEFYSHYGIAPKRIAKAFITNLSSFKLKEGASTITQQLIKNTHLTNEKSLPRKINEIALALQLEKQMAKKDILENYLNIIYFGNNCYGIENASNYYFSKHAKDLSILESATLAGIIKSPNFYSPIKHPDRCLSRRNLVLNEMKKDGILKQNDYLTLSKQPLSLTLNKTSKNKLNSYSQSAIDEAVNILKMPEKQIAIAGYKIYTYQDLDKQKLLENAFDEWQPQSDYAGISINPQNGGIEAFIGNSNYKILDYKRQPASAIKPLIVYGPALNENVISPATLILDEPITIDNYSPKNVGGGYNGYVSARESLSRSLNIPAVKTASYIGMNKLQHYGKKLSIDFDARDNNYAVALGGFTYGVNLKDLTGGYTAFSEYGYTAPKFVHYITNKDGKIIYKNNSVSTNVFREDTAYLMTDMLKTCAKSGTAKKLADLPFEVAAKTGTAGNKNGNTDAYNISYTSEDVVGIWLGNMDNTLISDAGGGKPTSIAKNYLRGIYTSNLPHSFSVPNSVEYIDLDASELENNHKLVKANFNLGERYKIRELFSRFNLPKENYTAPSLKAPVVSAQLIGKKALISFECNEYLSYQLYKTVNNSTSLLQSFNNKNGTIEVSDYVKSGEKISYYVICSLKEKGSNDVVTAKSNVVNLFSPNNDSDNSKWYI